MHNFSHEGCAFFLIQIKIIGGIKMKKTAIITGSSRGLGAKIAITLLEKGYNVVVNYKQNKDKAEKLIRNYNQSRAIALSLIHISEPTRPY